MCSVPISLSLISVLVSYPRLKVALFFNFSEKSAILSLLVLLLLFQKVRTQKFLTCADVWG